jgi:alkylation response protein AidB-like acyl-CoA dehydrogenase
VAEIAPLIAAEAEKAEGLGELTPAVVEALHESGLFGLILPSELGGLGLSLPDAVEVCRAIAEHDASTAWTFAILADGPIFGRMLEPDAFAELAAGGPPLIAGTLNPLTSRATPVDGGYRLTGTAGYASGSHHATWLMAGAFVHRDGEPSFVDGIPELIAGFLPVGEATINPTWAPSGMRATGSDDCTLDDVFVPERLTFRWGDPVPREGDTWSQIPLQAQLGPALAATVVGAARGAQQLFADLAGAKVPAASFQVLADRPQAHVAAGEAEGLLLAAEATLAAAGTEVWQQGVETRPFTDLDRARLRARAVTAVRLAGQAVDLYHDVGGMSSVKQGSPLERIWRDVHTATQHILLNVARYEIIGRIVLGRDPGTPVI